MESRPLWKGATMTTNRIRNNGSSLEHCLCPVCPPVYSSVCKTVTPLPTHTFLKWRFLTDFERHTHTPPPPPPKPQGDDILVH